MRNYLLDTNAISALMREPDGAVARRINEVGEDNVGVSIIVAAELRYGARKRASEALRLRVETALAQTTVFALEPPADAIYGSIRHEVESQGRPIKSNDLLIAAHAMALGRVLVTANVREFERVAGLVCENWLS